MVQMAPRAVIMALFLVLVFLIETETGAQFYDQSYALVVGIDKYRSPKWRALTYAVKDAQGMAEFLKQQGFQVTSIYNEMATRNNIVYEMQNVLARRVKKGDRVLVFFAGHGDTERYDDIDYGYIIPHDATDSSHTYISMEELQTLSRKMGQAKHQLFIMDACYGGLLGVRSGGISEKVPNYLDEITKRKARQILTAGGPKQQVVDGGPGKHSVFTGYLLKGLQEGAADLNGDGYVTFAELTSYLVPAATNAYQTPGYSALPGHELGEFTFRSHRGMTQPRTEPTAPTSMTRRGPGLAESPGQPKAIKLYTSWPMQGAMKPEGVAMKRAVDLAVEHAGNIVAGHKIEVVNLDDASPVTGSWDGTVEAENAQKAIYDPDSMVYIGTYNSGAAKVSMPITNKAGLAQVTVANTYPGLTKPGNAPGEPGIYRPTGKVNYFRPFPSDDIQGAAAAKLAQCLGFKRVFVLDDRQLYGKGIADVFEKTAKKLGLQIVGREGIESVDIDFRALLTKVKAANANLVYGGFVIDSGGPQVIQQMKALGLFDAGVKFMGPDGLYSPELVKQATPAAVNNNVYVTFAGLPPDQLPTEVGKRFYVDYKMKYKEEPIGWAMYAYQAGIVTLDAIRRADSKTREEILEAMRNTRNFEGITGMFSFDANGDTNRADMGVFLVKDSKFWFVGLITHDKCP